LLLDGGPPLVLRVSSLKNRSSKRAYDPDCYLFIFQGIFNFLSDCSGHFTHILREVGGKMPAASWEKRKIQGEMKG